MVLRRHLLPLALGLAGLFLSPAMAQDAGDVSLLGEQAETALQQAEPTDVEVGELLDENARPLGIVQEIDIVGPISVNSSVVRRQLSFKAGETLTEGHIARSTRLLRKLRLFSTIKIRFSEIVPEADLDADAENAPVLLPPTAGGEAPEARDLSQRPLRVTVQLYQGRSYYVFPNARTSTPYLIGGTIGDRDAFGTGLDVSGTLYSVGSTEYYNLRVTDPQFVGGHQRMTYSATLSDSFYAVRDVTNPNTRESYDISRDGLEVRYRTNLDNTYLVDVGLEGYQVATTVRRGLVLDSDPKTFLLSQTNINDGTLIYLTGRISENATVGSPLVWDGYSWSAGTKQSFEALGSFDTFATYRVEGATFFPLWDKHCFGVGARYETSTGNPPHYEAPRAGPRIRGYTGIDYYSESTLTLNSEFRFMVDEQLGQIVVFFDAGRGYDGNSISLNDMEYGYGLGVRVRTKQFLPVDYLLYADFAWGSEDTEFKVGLGQFF